MKYHLVTLGCPKNVTDSEQLTRALRAAGHAPVDSAAPADLLIVNSCGFIDAAKAESEQTARQLGIEKGSEQRLIVVGCWSQIEPERAESIAGVDRSFGIEAYEEIVGWLGPSEAVDIPETTEARSPASIGRGASAYLKISDGCARPCTFCNIPGIKGRRFRSTPEDTLVEEAKRLAEAGAKELVLVAQDSTAYGEERREQEGTARLLERMLGAISQDISRQNSHLAAKRDNLQILQLAVANGEPYGISLANRAFVGATASPARPVAPGRGDRPLVVIRFDRPDIRYQQPLYRAVSLALERRPSAVFTLVAVSPAGAADRPVAVVRDHAEDVKRALIDMGLPPEQVFLTALASPDLAGGEVRLYVR